jgi:hypothetical protein
MVHKGENMRNWKVWAINFFGVVGLVTLLSALILNRSAGAARVDIVPTLNIQNMERYQGKFLQVIYAVGRYPTIPTSINQIQLIQIKSIKTAPIVAGDLVMPQIPVEKSGLFPSYNVVVLVVTDQPDFQWNNYDGSSVEGPTGSGSRAYVAVDLISRPDIEAVIPRSEQNGVYTHPYR